MKPCKTGRVMNTIHRIISIAAFAEMSDAAEEFVAGEILVGFQPGARDAQADAIRNGLRATKFKACSRINAGHGQCDAGVALWGALSIAGFHRRSAEPEL